MVKNLKIKSKRKSSKRWLWLVGGALVLLILAVVVWFASGSSTPRANTNANTNAADITSSLPNSTNAFGVGTLVGKPAPAFTLPDAEGKPYAFQPGDGKKYVLAFNMGFA